MSARSAQHVYQIEKPSRGSSSTTSIEQPVSGKALPMCTSPSTQRKNTEGRTGSHLPLC